MRGKTSDMMQRLTGNVTQAARREEQLYLANNVFHGLEAVPTRFDSPDVLHFTATHFRTVLERCVTYRVLVSGAEVFTHLGMLLEVVIAPNASSNASWAFEVLDRFESHPSLSFCASLWRERDFSRTLHRRC